MHKISGHLQKQNGFTEHNLAALIIDMQSVNKIVSTS